MTTQSTPEQSAHRDTGGAPLEPGYNVDPVDIAAGLAMMKQLGYDSPEHHMEVEYNLNRHARGEEHKAMEAMGRSLSGVSLTSWYVILAAAVASGTRKLELERGHASAGFARVVWEIDESLRADDTPASIAARVWTRTFGRGTAQPASDECCVFVVDTQAGPVEVDLSDPEHAHLFTPAGEDPDHG